MTTDFPFDDLDKSMDVKERDIMLDVILSWARYDSLISQWVVLSYGIAPDVGTLLLGNMDTRTKLDRMKALYEHHGMEKAAKRIANLKKGHLEHVGIRNSIAHSHCAGRRISDPSKIVFAPYKAFKGALGRLTVEHIDLKAMEAAAKYATVIGDQLIKLTDPLEPQRPVPPPEPPEFLPETRPIPRGRRRGTRQRPRRDARDRSER